MHDFDLMDYKPLHRSQHHAEDEFEPPDAAEDGPLYPRRLLPNGQLDSRIRVRLSAADLRTLGAAIDNSVWQPIVTSLFIEMLTEKGLDVNRPYSLLEDRRPNMVRFEGYRLPGVPYSEGR